jgi:ribosomal protein S12 methylthiotransferase accessory factor YcaO
MTKHQLFEGFIGQNKLALDHGAVHGNFAAVSFFSPEYNDGGHDALDYAFGSSVTATAAKKTAWHEALERIYVFSKPQNAHYQRDALKSLKPSLSILDLSIWEKKFCTLDSSGSILRGTPGGIKEKLRWYEGNNLEGEISLIPEHLLFCNTWESNINLYLASSGCAIFSSLWQSRLRAALELIERDCSLRSWVTGNSGHVVRAWKNYDAELNGLSKSCGSLGLTAIIRNLSDIPGVSVIIVLLVSKKGIWPACSIGTSAKPFQPAAIKSALYEALLNYVLQKRRGQDHMELPSLFNSPTSTHPIVHNHFYGKHENLHHLDLWLNENGGKKLDTTEYLKSLSNAAVLKYLRTTGKKFYF